MDNESAMPTISRDIHVSIPEHEVLFSFNSDADALEFLSFWHEMGEQAFYDWVDIRGERR